MKKLLFVALAAVGLTACVQNEELAVSNDKSAIAFDTFVENATKATAYNNSNLSKFYVYGTISQNGTVVTNIFDCVEVSNETGVWAYGSQYTQYWIPGFHYDFAAVVDGTVVKNINNMPEFIEVDMTEQKDVLYATADRDFGANDVAAKVGFTFNHLLAKAKFTVKNTIASGTGFVYSIESIKIKNADKNGAYDVATGVWSANNTYEADFGVDADLAIGSQPVSGSEVYLLPSANKDLDIQVVYNLTYKGTTLKSETKPLAAVLNIEQGKAYNFVVEFGNPGEEIEFEAIVNDWANGSVEVFQGVSVPVTTAQELAEAIANPEVGEAVLMNDIDLTSTITRSGEETPVIAKSFVIDGNGKKLNYSGSDRVIDITYKDGANDNLVVTIKNLTINCANSYCQRGINYNAGGLLIIDNVKFEGTAPTYAVNCPAYSDNAVVKIKNSELKGNIALNVCGSDMKVDVTDSHLISVDNTEVENYTAISLNSDGDTNIAEGTVVNIVGGSVIAYDENGDPSYAVRNSTATGCVNISESTVVVGELKIPVVNVVYEGYNEFYSFTTVQEAIDKVQADKNGTVRLMKDLVLTEPIVVAKSEHNVVLDLNGKTVMGLDKMQTGSYGLITNQGNLTVVGPGKLVVEAEYDRDWNAYSSVISNQPGGNLVVEGGVVIEHLGGTDMAYGIDNLTNGKDTSAIVTVKDATVKSTYRAIRQFLNGVEATNELYVNAGAVIETTGNKAIWMQSPSNNANSGKLVVEAGAQLKNNVYVDAPAAMDIEISVAESALVNGATVDVELPAGYNLALDNGAYTIARGTTVSTAEALKQAINAGEQTIYVKGQIDLTEEILANYNGTIIGADETACINTRTFVVKSADEAFHLSDKTINFKNITIKVPTEDGDFLKTGFVAAGTMNFDHCVLEGQVTLNGSATWTFDDCEFGGADSGAYASFVYAAKKVNFNRCSFSGVDRAAKVYGVGGAIDIVYNNCTFTSTTSNKYAVNIDASYATTKVALNGCSQTGMPGLYLVTGAKATVYVDGVQQ